MRRTVIGAMALGLALLAAEVALSGGPGPGGQPGQGVRRSMLDRLTNQLGLNEDQVAKVKDLDAQRRERVRAAGDNREKRREAMTWYQNEVRKLLTEEQAKKYDAMRAGRPQRGDFVSEWKERLGLTDAQAEKFRALGPLFRQKTEEAGRDRAKRREAWQWLQDEIRGLLTEHQRAKYDAAVKALRERVSIQGLARTDWALRNLNLTEAQRKRIGDLRRARDRKVKAAYDAYKASLKGVLTAEQIKKFEGNLKRTPRPIRRPGGRGGRGGEGRRERS